MTLIVPQGAKITPLAPIASSRLGWQERSALLFAGPPTVEQTQQGTIADCFILASLIAILSKPNGATAITNMMKEDGTDVIVRLYSDPGAAHFFRVPKGVILSEKRKATSRNCCWVDVLEACLSVFRMKAANNNPQPGPPLLENLDGGQAASALQHLLGVEGTNDQVISPKVDPSAPTAVQARHAGIAFVNLILDPVAVSASEADITGMFGGNPAMFRGYQAWLKLQGSIVKGAWTSYISTQKYKHTVVVDTVKEDRVIPISIRMDGFEQFVMSHFPKVYATPIVQFAQNAYLMNTGETLFPRRRSDGGVSVNEQSLFKVISDCLKEGWPVVASSNGWVGKPEGTGFSGGEDMAKGIVGGHCYAVTEAFLSGSRRMVKLVNPWRKYARVMVQTGGTTKPTATDPSADTSLGVMALPVRTVSKHFEFISYCQYPI